MKVIILEAFEGHPDGDDQPPKAYRPGVGPIEVPDAFGELIAGKGHARAADAGTAEVTHAAE